MRQVPLSTLAPVFLRELRLSHRRLGNWRTNWRWVLSIVAACAFLLLQFRQSGRNAIGLVQFISPLVGAMMVMMPLGFAADRHAGQQSLLRLTGLNPTGVFFASVAGSLLRLMELWLYAVPIFLAGSALGRVPPGGAVLFIAVMGAALVWIASLRILGVAVARTRSGAVPVAFAAGACLVLPAALDFWAGTRVGPGGAAVLEFVGGFRDWSALGRSLQGAASLAPLWRVLARLLFWILLFLAISEWRFRRDWLAAEDAGNRSSPWAKWLRWLPLGRTSTGPPAPTGTLPYGHRLPAPESWRRIHWIVAAILGLAAVVLTGSVSWRVLPGILMLGIAWVDIMAHLAVSGPVAEDRRDGGFELLFTTPLRPSEVLAAADRAGRGIVRAALAPGLGLTALAGALALWEIPPEDRASLRDGFLLLCQFSWPVGYALGLAYLPFELPASQAANTGEPFHAFAPPGTAFVVPLVMGGALWGMGMVGPQAQMAIAICGTLFLGVLLLVREQTASSQGMTDDEFRTVAAAPLPTDEFREKNVRNPRPWVPEDFRR